MRYLKLFEGWFDETNLTDEQIEQKLCGLANSERVLVEYGKSPNPQNTDKVTYTDLSDTSIEDDFTPYYSLMKDYLIKKSNKVRIKDIYNRKEYEFELNDNIVVATKI